MTRRFDGIVFDFNGTLLWDMDLHEEVWKEIVLRETGRELTQEEWIESFVGRTNLEIWPHVLNRPVSAAEAEERSEAKESAYRERLLSRGGGVQLVDGAPELFELCRENGIAVAIATAAGRTNKEFYVERFDLHRWFHPDHIVYDDGTMPGKPHPALFSTAMARLGLDPARCVVVEDGLLGIRAARAAGAGKVYGMASSDAEFKKLSRVPLERILRSYRDVTLDDFQ